MSRWLHGEGPLAVVSWGNEAKAVLVLQMDVVARGGLVLVAVARGGLVLVAVGSAFGAGAVGEQAAQKAAAQVEQRWHDEEAQASAAAKEDPVGALAPPRVCLAWVRYLCSCQRKTQAG
jgi:hypothetical protein